MNSKEASREILKFSNILIKSLLSKDLTSLQRNKVKVLLNLS